MTEPHFTPKFFEFLTELGENNNKPWFEANKKRFDADVRNPILQFVEDFGSRLQTVSKHFIAEPQVERRLGLAHLS